MYTEIVSVYGHGRRDAWFYVQMRDCPRKDHILSARHAHAETLFQVCCYIRNSLGGLQVARPGGEKLIRKIILAYITEAIDRASKD